MSLLQSSLFSERMLEIFGWHLDASLLNDI
jgi:hypothetical protein